MSAGYSGLIQSAESLASKPYQPYTGELTAPVGPVQNNAITGIANSTQQAQPLLNQAAGFAAQSATPLTAQQYSPAAIAQYESPYTQSVVDATQAQFAKSNAQQQAQLQGGTAAAGALGGDRAAILQSELAGQQNAAQAPTIANLYNTGFGNAQTEFNNQQGVGLSTQQANNTNAGNAGYALSNIGLGQENASLSGYGAELGAGALEQQTQQAGDTADYNQFLQAQGYPYQSLDFLGSILANASSGAGTTSTGTSNSTSTTPFNPFSLIGLGNPYRAGGRTRLDTGGFAPVQSYVPDVQATPPQMIQAPKGFDSTGDDGSDSSQGGSGSNKAGGLLQLAMAFLADGGRARLADGGFAPVVTDYPNIRSYIPAVQATPPQMHGMSADSSNDNSNGPNYGSGSGGGGVFGQNGFFGSGQNGQGGGFDTVVKDAGSAGDDVMSFLSALASGGRTRLSGGGFARLADGGIDGLDMDSGDGADAYSLPSLMALLNASSGVPQPTGAAPPGDFVAPTPTPRPDQSDDTTTTIAPPASGFAPSGDGGAYTLPTDANDVSVASVPAQDAPSAALATGFAPVGASALSVGDTPAPWRDIATNYADTQTPVWDDGTPVDPSTAPSPGQGGGFGPVNAGTPAFSVAPNKPDIWQSVLSGLGGFLSHGTIGAGINAGLADYENQRDPHPQLDHSGSTVMLNTRGADGSMKVFDTGIPTEASLNRQTQQGWHEDQINAANQRSSDAIAAATQRSQDAINERTIAAKQQALLKWEQMRQTALNNGQPEPPIPPELQDAASGSGGVGAANLTNNNPGNIRVPNGTAFQTFPTMQAGIDAVGAQLTRYMGRGVNTIAKMAATYAPKGDGANDPVVYAANVQKLTGIDQNKPLTPADIPKVRDAFIQQENGRSPAELLASGAQLIQNGSQPTQAPEIDPAIDLAAHMFLKTGQMPPLGMGASGMRRQILTRAAQLAGAGGADTIVGNTQDYRAGMRAVSAFDSGLQGNQTRFINNTLGHLDLLSDYGKALNNGDIRTVNTLKQTIAKEFGSAAPTNFDTIKPLVANEIIKAIVNSGGGVTDRAEAQDTLAKASSWPQLAGAIQAYQHVFGTQLHGLGQQYQAATGRTDYASKYLSPPAQRLYGETTPQQNSNGSAKPTAAAIPQRPAPVPPGSKYSPSRKMWRDGNNRYYNAAGQPVQ